VNQICTWLQTTDIVGGYGWRFPTEPASICCHRLDGAAVRNGKRMVADLGEAPDTPNKRTPILVTLIAWELWNEWNACVFNRKEQAVRSLLAKVEEIRMWILAGAKGLSFEVFFCPSM
jgi:hypothetical protein